MQMFISAKKSTLSQLMMKGFSFLGKTPGRKGSDQSRAALFPLFEPVRPKK